MKIVKRYLLWAVLFKLNHLLLKKISNDEEKKIRGKKTRIERQLYVRLFEK